MAYKRSVDIAKVEKHPAQRAGENRGNYAHRPITHPRQTRLKILRLSLNSLRAVFESNMFQLSLMRNLLSLRTIFFALIPLIYIQLRYFLILKPDELLYKLKSLLLPQNTSLTITFGGLILAVLMVSFLAELLIFPALLRYYYQKIGHRRPKMARSLQDSMSMSYTNIGLKVFKILILLTISSAFIISLYLTFLLLSQDNIVLFASLLLVGLVFTILFLIYTNLRFWLVGCGAIACASPKKIPSALAGSFGHPVRSMGFGLNWLIYLLLFVLISLGAAIAQIGIITSSDSLWVQIFTLAAGTTITYIIWTIWTAWQAGYWATILEHYGPRHGLTYLNLEESRVWQFVSLAVIAVIISILYVLIAYSYSDRIINMLDYISSKIPDRLNISLPKPQ